MTWVLYNPIDYCSRVELGFSLGGGINKYVAWHGDFKLLSQVDSLGAHDLSPGGQFGPAYSDGSRNGCTSANPAIS
jgi:hypothetical protein